ncbi:Ig-like domain-containing protein [candidate division CSSED10-310 bacterium]|uniref:Ig-like domain-containing protein n=1 Tax=candidate division CSSED10-310 bacterium TaxID=2855610 RepID=A0ABV6YYG3_UNCC1
MFLINDSMSGINLKRQKLRRLQQSLNIVSVSAPNNIVAPARAFIVTTQTRPGDNIFIVLIFTKKSVKPIFFEFHKNPVSAKRALSVEEDALSFVEDMGFEMHEIPISDEARDNVDEWVNKLKVFYFPQPTGNIELQPASESIVADGSSQVLIESQPILDTDGDTVSNDTPFIVKTSQGMVVNPFTTEMANPATILSKSGFLTFAILSSTDVGLSTIQVRSQSGSARGLTRVIFVPGDPAGEIVLSPNEIETIADGTRTISIESAAIKDERGNMIADGAEFVVSCTSGSVLDPSARKGEQKIKILSRGSALKFLYKAAKKTGLATITVQSMTGIALGECRVKLIAGPPAGDIEVTSSHATVQVKDHRQIKITTEIITDEAGNAVSDDIPFLSSTDVGLLVTDDGIEKNEIELYPRQGIISFGFQPGTKAGFANINLKAMQGNAKGSCSVMILAGGPTTNLNLRVDQDELYADGRSIARIFTETPIVDDYGNVIEDDTPFNVIADNGSIVGLLPGNVALSAGGNISFEYLSPTTGKSARITVQGPGTKSKEVVEIALIPLDPVGTIVMSSSQKSMTANETDECEIGCEPIVTSAGTPVTDGTTILVEINLGEFISFDGSRMGQKMEAYTTEGTFNFQIRVGKKRGTMTVKAKSMTGSAEGELSIPILAEVPEGSIELKAEKDSIVADGKSRVWITSEAITDAYENFVDDGTLITVECERGEILAEKLTRDEEGYQIPTLNGIIRFQLEADTRTGTAQITALSVDGFAMGTIDINLISGPAHGTIELQCKQTERFRVDHDLIDITSSIIQDRHGNTVNDENIFTIRADQGSLLDAKQDQENESLRLNSQNGYLNFHYKAGSKPGKVTISLEDTTGNSSGELRFEIFPGLPSGLFELQSEKEELLAGETEPYLIKSQIITDLHDNVIEDGLEFTVTADPPLTLYAQPETPFPDAKHTVTSQAGLIQFWVTSEEPVTTRIQAQSVLGEAKSQLDLDFAAQTATGIITLNAEKTSLVADGESTTFVSSDVIQNASHKPVSDGALFALNVENGFAYIDDLEKAASEIELLSKEGKLSFYLISTPQIGTLKCSVSSKEGDARGDCEITLVTGFPFGYVSLSAEKDTLYSGEPEPVHITSDLIRDRHKNTVSDNIEITASCKNGTVSLHKEYIGQEEIKVPVTNGALSFFAFTPATPATMRISVWSEDQQAKGDLDIEVEHAPPVPEVPLSYDQEELIADGISMIEVRSPILKDLFNKVIPDEIEYIVTLQDGVGLVDSMEEPEAQFSVFSQDGLIRFKILAPTDTATITADVIAVDYDSNGTLSLTFNRPRPYGEIILTAPQGTVQRAGSTDAIPIQSDIITSDRSEPVLDGEKFLITCSMGNISSESGRQADKGWIVPAQESRIAFTFHPPSEVGQAMITVSACHSEAHGELSIQLVAGPPSGTIILAAAPSTITSEDRDPIHLTSQLLKDSHNHQISDEWEFQVTIEGGTGALSNQEKETGTETFQLTPDNGLLSFYLYPAENVSNILITVSASAAESEAQGELSLAVMQVTPTGEIILIPNLEHLTADGKSTTTICSEIILNNQGEPVPDGEKFMVHSDKGSISSASGEVTEEGVIITAATGKVSFALRASKKSGVAHLQISSLSGDARGERELNFEPGEASGNIALTADPLQIIADGSSKTLISSETITDLNGNVVADGTLIFMETDAGELSSQTQDQKEDEAFSVPTVKGKIEADLKASTQAGVATIIAWSQLGNAIGNLEVFMTRGLSEGEIILLPSSHEPHADGQEITTISTLPIKDKCGNYVADDETFMVTISRPDKQQEKFECSPKSGKLEIEIKAQTIPGETIIDVKSSEGKAAGTVTLLYQPQKEKDVEDDEWFFAESEDDFLVEEPENVFDEETDEFGRSIDDSFSKIISPSEEISPQDTTTDKDKKKSDENPLLDFYKFFAGF